MGTLWGALPFWEVNVEVWREYEKKNRDLDYCIKQLQVNGTAFAEAERAYKVRLRAESLALKSEGMPVTLIQLTVYGVPEVADLRFERDKAETIWRANLEAIYSIRLQLKLLESQMRSEMSAPSLGYGS